MNPPDLDTPAGLAAYRSEITAGELSLRDDADAIQIRTLEEVAADWLNRVMFLLLSAALIGLFAFGALSEGEPTATAVLTLVGLQVGQFVEALWERKALREIDLETPAGLAAYRAELKAVARWPRAAGLAAIVLGAGFVILASQRMLGLEPPAVVYGYATLAVGWVLLIVAFLQRNRYHRRRMSEIRMPSP